MKTTISTTLIDLHNQALAMTQEMFEVEGDEAIDAFWARLDDWAAASGSKLLAYSYVKKRLEAQVVYYREQADALNRAARRSELQVESIKDRAGAFLAGQRALTGKARVDLPDGGWVRLQRTKSTRVDVDDDATLEARFMRFTEPRPDLAALKSALKDGAAIPGVRLVVSESEHTRWSR